MSISDDELLSVAMGVNTLNTETKKKLEETRLTEHFTRSISNQKETLQVRKEIRREILQMNFLASSLKVEDSQQFADILEKEYEKGEWNDRRKVIYNIINDQMDSNRSIKWENFTHTWDLHPRNQSTVIIREAWPREGGQFDEIGACFPVAFTKQEY